MVKGTTSTGFEFEIDERRAKSWGMVKKIALMQKAKTDMEIYGVAIDLIGQLLGEEQEEALVAHVTALCGYDDAEKVAMEVFDIFKQSKNAPELKNSSSSQDVSQPVRMPLSVTSQNTTESMTTSPYQSNTPQLYAPDFGTGAGL